GSLPRIQVGIHSGIIKAVELTFETDGAIIVPKQPDDLQRLLEAARRFAEIEAIRNGVGSFARTNPEDEAAFREVIESQGGLCEHGGMPAHSVDHARRDRNVPAHDSHRASHDHSVKVTMR